MKFYAHTSTLADGTTTNQDSSSWEPLFTPFGPVAPADPTQACSGKNGATCPHCDTLAPQHGHLNKVAHLCAQFAAEMFPPGPDREAARQWGYLTGLWHDLGKFISNFQRKLLGENLSVEHSGAGAVFAKLLFEPHLADRTHHYPIAAVIAGHHAGLSNFRDQGLGQSTPLLQRIKNNEPLDLDLSSDELAELAKVEIPRLPRCALPLSDCPQDQCRQPFFVRMLFSCLVDADSLVTEALEKQGERNYEYSSIAELQTTLDGKLSTLSRDAKSKKLPINDHREAILSVCQTAAEQPRAIFSLNVPTGGGKTLSGMSFALRHCLYNTQKRVIVVAPYTTIIEQTADEYRKFLGDRNIIEHHSNLDDFNDVESLSESARKKQLAAENWDAPVIVTTTVQFFESLFGNKRGRCRKLHNIANSVIILDEAQCLPTPFLDPTLFALQELVEHYGCSLVLSTATQPAFAQRPKFPFGFANVIPILDPRYTAELHTELTAKRINIRWEIDAPIDATAAADLLIAEASQQKLIVVNTRSEASAAFEHIRKSPHSEPNLFHLSTNLCAAHRKQKLRTIKSLLTEGRPCTVVSTQLIECGVNHSYQCVMRSLAGLDSLAQSAGRCNRSGEFAEGGTFIVFKSDKNLRGYLANSQTASLIVLGTELPDHLADLGLYNQYFQFLYQSGAGRDTADVLPAYQERNLEDVAHRYRLIDDYKAYTVIIPWEEEGRSRLTTVRNILKSGNPLSRKHLRSLQPYSVSLSQSDFKIVHPYTEPLLEGGFSHSIDPTMLDQIYDENLGLILHHNEMSYLGCHD